MAQKRQGKGKPTGGQFQRDTSGATNIPTAQPDAAPVRPPHHHEKHNPTHIQPSKSPEVSIYAGPPKRSHKPTPCDEHGKIIYRLPDGRKHRLDGPAVMYPDGGWEFWENDQLHRDEKDGPAASYPDGTRKYAWRGLRHCTTGPAIVEPGKAPQFWVNGRRYTTEDDYNDAVKAYKKAHRPSLFRRFGRKGK